MFKKILSSLLLVFIFVSLSPADKTYIIDTPNSNILSYSSYNTEFRFFSNGNIISKIDFGVFKFLSIGVSWELDQFIGDKKVKVAIPALQVKFRIYEGNMTLPGIAIGYDGQGYFFVCSRNDKYLQKGRGLYLVAGREFFIDGLVVNVGANINTFSEPKVYGFINTIVPLYREVIFFMTEYDNVHYFPDARPNFGLKFSLTEYIDVDCIIRDCWGKEDVDAGRIPNERIFKVSYSGKF
ncbi:MAG: hypothetical protein LBT18_03545 [Endomicrobium sp.]|jgi:hypothetical protein|nr:hypothetical protein [Endomicrobium sp.]